VRNSVSVPRLHRQAGRAEILLLGPGAVTDADIDAATVAGAQGYIAKPFDVDNLIETLLNTIKAHTRITNS